MRDITYPFEGTIKMETAKDEEGKDKIVWDFVKPGSEWARIDKDNNLVHLDMDLCAQGHANAYTALAIGVWNAAIEAAANNFELEDGYYYDEVRDSILRNKK